MIHVYFLDIRTGFLNLSIHISSLKPTGLIDGFCGFCGKKKEITKLKKNIIKFSISSNVIPASPRPLPNLVYIRALIDRHGAFCSFDNLTEKEENRKNFLEKKMEIYLRSGSLVRRTYGVQSILYNIVCK
jgi:hypothetical protein